MRRAPRLLLIVLSLLLLGAQQAAVAHLIAHVGASTEAVAHSGDEGHGAALSLSHVCTSCLAFDAFGAAPPPALPDFGGVTAAIAPVAIVAAVAQAAWPQAYRARAPPIALR